MHGTLEDRVAHLVRRGNRVRAVLDAIAHDRASVHDRIDEYAIAFLDHYVRGTAAEETLTSSGTGVAVVRYDSELGSGVKDSRRRR